MTVPELLQQVKGTLLGAQVNQDIPYDQVVESLRPSRALSHSPIFQVMFVLQNAPREPLRLPGITLVEREVPLQTAQFDLTLSLRESGSRIEGFLNYASDLFDEGTIRRWVGLFESVLTGMVRSPQGEIDRLPLISDAERQLVQVAFNATHTVYPRDRLVHELFEEQVKRAPDAVAAVYEDESLSYAQLNARANRLARYLTERGVRPGEYVPVLMQRSLAMLIAQLAVLKCGAVYVPIDPELPAERQAFMIRDCNAGWILTDLEQRLALDDQPAQWIDCTAVAEQIRALPASNLGVQMDSAAPAYVMFTSGSTGTPKGVVVPHRAMNRLVINCGYAKFGPEDCLTHSSNTAFDASTFEIWGALLNGAKLVIVPAAVVLEAGRFADLILQHRVTVLWISVGLLNRYADLLAPVFPRLRYVITGGDVLEPQTLRRVLRNSPPENLLNAYGPTESTTFATTYLVREVDEATTSIPIGRPISNTQIYILDANRELVPIGAPGEIYIGGEGVALGYLNRPDLTRERFIPDPFSSDPQARLYRTGDLGRWRSDGNVEFLGRNDQQVKIRGFRIELGEIEAQIARHPQVKEVGVIAREDIPGQKRLVAYITARNEAGPGVDELREQLKAVLPEYMVPSAFVTLPILPLTPNGKLDRRALPAPAQDAYASRTYEAPHTEIEETLAGIWKELLRVERVGRQDHFFDLGGHSLLALQVIARIHSALSVDVPMRLLFQFPTLEALAARIEDARHAQLLNELEHGGEDVEKLLETLMAMPESEVQQRVQELMRGARS
jgi:amino acid adenylation domain-containing protein